MPEQPMSDDGRRWIYPNKPEHGPNNVTLQMQLPSGQGWVLLEVKFSLN